jgi:glycosyltransferase involved in cell wall biosynthesis
MEGFALAVLESLACGTPVITSDTGGLPEATRGLPGRMIVPAGQWGPLAESLDRALGGELDLPDAGECRAHAERFSLPALADRHLTIYRRAVRSEPERRTRVVYLDHCARLSGAELALLRIIRSLDGVEPHVILGEEGPLEVRLRESGISTEVLPLAAATRELGRGRVRLGGAGIRAPALGAAYALRLARRLRRLRPDLVHANTLKSGLYGGVASRLSGRPLVWHLHDRLAEDYMPRQAASLARSAIDRLPDRVIVNSEATLRTLGERGARRTEVIPYPIELPASPVEIRDRVRRVGMLGRLAPWKGQHLFLEAFAQAFPASDVEAVVIGAPLFGEEEYAEGLRRLAVSLGLEKRVSFPGHVDDVQGELARLDLLAHASTVPEPFGQVVLEGLAAGLPVIAASAGGPAEIIHDGVDGLLFPAGDLDALSERMRGLAGDRDLRSRLGSAGRERARDFAPDAVALRVLDVYAGILEDRGLRTAITLPP